MRQRLHDEHERKLEAAIADYKAQGESLLNEHSVQRRKEHEEELKRLRASYERKVAEQKDRVAIANKLARQREAGVDNLQVAASKNVETSKELDALRQQVEQLRRAKEDSRTCCSTTAFCRVQ